MAIPRIIHQTCASVDALSPEIRTNIAFLKSNNPGWDYRLYDDAAVTAYFEKRLKPASFKVLQTLNPKYGVVRADLFRYLVVYNEGGVYLDIKSTARQPLDEVLRPDDQFLISQWPNRLGERKPGAGLYAELVRIPGGEFQQWHVIAQPGHAFLKNVLDHVLFNCANYSQKWFGTGKIGVLRVSGPICYTFAIAPLLPLTPNRVVNIEDLGFRYSIYEEAGQFNGHMRSADHYSKQTEPIFLR